MHTNNLYLDDSPASAGTIVYEGADYSNGAVVAPSCNKGYTISPNAADGYGFNDWSFSGSGSVSSLNSNTITYTASGTNGATGYLTANYLPLDSVQTLSYSSGGSSGSGSAAPQSYSTTGSALSGFAPTEYCGKDGGDPYCFWFSTGTINSNNYAYMVLIDNTSSHTDGGLYSFPTGNTSVEVTMQLVNSNSVNIDAMSITFAPASGNSVNVGDAFEETYSSQLGTGLVNLQDDIWNQGHFMLGDSNQTLATLGESFMTMSYSLGDLSYVLSVTPPTSSYDNFNVPHLYAGAFNWKSIACPIGYAGVAAGGVGIIIASVAATGGADIEVTPIAFAILDDTLSGVSLYLACSS